MAPLLQVEDLQVHFFIDEGTVRAVDGVSFSLEQGKTLGIVGESGSGKSVIGQTILRIVPSPGKIVNGKILFQAGGKEIAAVPHDRKRRHIPYRLVLLKLAPYNHKIPPSLYDAAAPQFGYGGTRRHSGNRKPKGIPGMRGHASAPVSRNVQKRSDT